MSGDSKQVEQARRIQAIAQIGLEYAEDPYDRERYEELRAIAAEMMAGSSDLTSAGWLDVFRNETGYATPKVDVRGAVFRDGEVLLCREASDGLWSLPGGWADVNEPPSRAVVRELREEIGYEVRCTKLAAVLDRDLHVHDGRHPFHIYKLMFLCDIVGKPEALCHDIMEAAFFSLEALPSLSLHRTLPLHIELMHQHYLDPALPTAFD